MEALGWSHAIGGGAGCPQPAGLGANVPKRVGVNALHLKAIVSERDLFPTA